MGRKIMVLGYTRGGHEVLMPTHQAPDMAQFVDWTPGDHLDAARILTEHSERANDPIGYWCSHWANTHWAIGKITRRQRHKPRAVVVHGAAEAKILIGRRKR